MMRTLLAIRAALPSANNSRTFVLHAPFELHHNWLAGQVVQEGLRVDGHGLQQQKQEWKGDCITRLMHHANNLRLQGHCHMFVEAHRGHAASRRCACSCIQLLIAAKFNCSCEVQASQKAPLCRAVRCVCQYGIAVLWMVMQLHFAQMLPRSRCNCCSEPGFCT